jgi:hypothetical protein
VVLARFQMPVRPAPEWERNGVGESLSFTAVPARLWVFGAMIAVVTLGAGALVSVLAIALAPGSAGTARILIVAAALCLCLPLVILVKAPFRTRTVGVKLTYDAEAMTIAIGAESRRLPFREITGIVWCTGTEYSRVVVDAPGRRCSLLAGIARPLRGLRSDLPTVSADLHRALEGAGLSVSASRPGYRRYQR